MVKDKIRYKWRKEPKSDHLNNYVWVAVSIYSWCGDDDLQPGHPQKWSDSQITVSNHEFQQRLLEPTKLRLN